VVAAVQAAIEIERFLHHLHLWPESGEIRTICGPELFEAQDIEPPDPWEDFDAPQPLDQVA